MAFYGHQFRICGPGYFSRYSDRSQPEESWERFLEGGEIVRTHTQIPCAPHCLLLNGYGVIPEVKRPGCGVEKQPHLAPWLKKE